MKELIRKERKTHWKPYHQNLLHKPVVQVKGAGKRLINYMLLKIINCIGLRGAVHSSNEFQFLSLGNDSGSLVCVLAY